MLRSTGSTDHTWSKEFVMRDHLGQTGLYVSELCLGTEESLSALNDLVRSGRRYVGQSNMAVRQIMKASGVAEGIFSRSASACRLATSLRAIR